MDAARVEGGLGKRECRRAQIYTILSSCMGVASLERLWASRIEPWTKVTSTLAPAV